MIEEVRGEYQFRIKVRNPKYAMQALREWRESLPAASPKSVEKPPTGFSPMQHKIESEIR
mgnify:FL=1